MTTKRNVNFSSLSRFLSLLFFFSRERERKELKAVSWCSGSHCHLTSPHLATLQEGSGFDSHPRPLGCSLQVASLYPTVQ